MNETPHHVLFVCTANSARSIIAEALLNHAAGGRFVAHSAGSHLKGEVHPLTLATLAALNLPSAGLRSKSWDEFSRPGAPQLDFVFTVCDDAAGEVCPMWPGAPVTAHWGIADPAAVDGSEAEKTHAFMTTAVTLRRRIELMLALPREVLHSLGSGEQLHAIGSR